MLVGGGNINPAELIATDEDWLDRYRKYIPGYKWAPNQGDWDVEPYIAQVDLGVNSIVMPGDVFVMGSIDYTECDWPEYPAFTQLDVQFFNAETDCYTWKNQWGEEISGDNNTNIASMRFNQQIFLFKILNDSIKKGLKPATDPYDFELIDAIGMAEGGKWEFEGENTHRIFSVRRNPEVYKGNPVLGSAMGSETKPSEYFIYDFSYYGDIGLGGTDQQRAVISDVGKHFFNAPTFYMSTVGSVVYKVSEGYKSPQQIKGVSTGTTVSNFIDNIIKKNENQLLTLTSAVDGLVLGMDAVLSLNDILTVLSADSVNTTKYVLNVTNEGLSSNAVLTSNIYTIEINQQPAAVGETKSAVDNHLGAGTINGFEYGTTIQTIINNVTVPAGATMTVISGDGAYVPIQTLNYDSTYVTVTVNANTYFEVLAENGITRINYQLIPESSSSDAFVTSDLYSVAQKNLLIDFVPRGINVQNFLSNLVIVQGASMKLVDKLGFERKIGVVADDDKLVVTSANGEKTVVYHISKLATEFIPTTTYLAYIMSNVYGIDQVNYKIHNVSGISTISDFYSKITVASGANAVVVDNNGIEKTSGDIDNSDMVKVTSADGKIKVMYSFGQLTGTEWLNTNQIEIYPNPSNGRLNVSGVEKGQRIQVYNAVGSAIIDMNVESNHEIISIDQHPAGFYLIVVSDGNRLLGKYKAIKY